MQSIWVGMRTQRTPKCEIFSSLFISFYRNNSGNPWLLRCSVRLQNIRMLARHDQTGAHPERHILDVQDRFTRLTCGLLGRELWSDDTCLSEYFRRHQTRFVT